MDIEFDCGMIAKNVGSPAMAAKTHLGKCTDKACQDDVRKAAEKHKGVIW